MARSIAVVISGGFPPSVPKDLPTDWLVGRVDMLRVSIFWLIGIALICNYMLKKTNFGSWVYATGENQEAAKDLGINTFWVKTTCFMICSVLAGFAGIIQSFRIKTVITSLGQGLELQAIASAVVGGASLMGGIGSAFGALIGTLLLSIIDNILILSRIDGNWFKFAVGALIVIAVILNTLTKNSAGLITDYKLSVTSIFTIDLKEKAKVIELKETINIKNQSDSFEQNTYEKNIKRIFASSIREKLMSEIFNINDN